MTVYHFNILKCKYFKFEFILKMMNYIESRCNVNGFLRIPIFNMLKCIPCGIKRQFIL